MTTKRYRSAEADATAEKALAECSPKWHGASVADPIEKLARRIIAAIHAFPKSPRSVGESRLPKVPDTVEELLASIDEDEGAVAIFWAMTDEEESVAEARFRVRGGRGLAVATVEREGRATGWKVHIPAMGTTTRGVWDDRIPIDAYPGDVIRFSYHERSEQIWTE